MNQACASPAGTYRTPSACSEKGLCHDFYADQVLSCLLAISLLLQCSLERQKEGGHLCMVGTDGSEQSGALQVRTPQTEDTGTEIWGTPGQP